MKPVLRFIALASCGVFGVLGLSSAGQFNATSVTPIVTVNSTNETVVAEGEARYVGTPDPDDRNAAIQTTVEDTFHGPPGDSGRGYNVDGPFTEGQIIRCKDEPGQGDTLGRCPGRAVIPRRSCEFPRHRYQAKTAATVFHPSNPDISVKVGVNTRVSCIPPLLPPDCPFQGTGGEKVISVTGGPQIVHAVTSDWFPLERMEERDGFRYLMEEWAVIAVDREPMAGVRAIEVLSASSSPYGAYRRDRLFSDIEASQRRGSDEIFVLRHKGVLDEHFRPGRSVLLAIDHPPHPSNHRSIPMPAPRVLPESAELSGTSGKVVVRADFGEDRSVVGFELLYSDRALSNRERASIENGLSLEYSSPKQHRAVLFAVLNLGERLDIERSHVVLPQCCGTPAPLPFPE